MDTCVNVVSLEITDSVEQFDMGPKETLWMMVIFLSKTPRAPKNNHYKIFK